MTDLSDPPLRLLLGEDAYNRTIKKLAHMAIEVEKWKAITLSTDYPEITNN